MLDGGLHARTYSDPSKLPADFVGRDLDPDCYVACPPAASLGENGKFHTFTHSGPMFDQPIPIADGEP